MNNKKGFTLVELLVVVAIISVITTSISINVLNMFENQKSKLNDQDIKKIEDAACTYAEIIKLRESCDDKNMCNIDVQVSKLIQEGYIEEDYFSANSKEVVEVNWDEGLKSCTYDEVGSGE